MRTKLLVACCVVTAAAALVRWLGTVPEPEPVLRAAVERVTARAGHQFSSDSPWLDNSPFAPLSCKLKNGDRFASSACDPAPEDPLTIDPERPEVAAGNALTKIKAREFDKLHILAASLNACWFIHSRSLNQREPLNQQVSPECNFAEVTRLMETAESVLRTASTQGDYVARQAYVDLLSTKVMVRQNQMQFFDLASTDSVTIRDVEKLESEIDAIRGQVVTFIGSLSSPSDDLVATSKTVTELRDARMQEKSTGQGSR